MQTAEYTNADGQQIEKYLESRTSWFCPSIPGRTTSSDRRRDGTVCPVAATTHFCRIERDRKGRDRTSNAAGPSGATLTGLAPDRDATATTIMKQCMRAPCSATRAIGRRQTRQEIGIGVGQSLADCSPGSKPGIKTKIGKTARKQEPKQEPIFDECRSGVFSDLFGHAISDSENDFRYGRFFLLP